MQSRIIKLLPQNIVNQIAAGEVIERPSSVIKELLENAIDAEASDITVKVVDGGKNLISISDNGCGMNKEALEMCIMSHATSKLSSENLFDIHTFGFRGEALPSIASVARLSITTCDNGENEAWKLQMEGQKIIDTIPSTRAKGTTIEVRDLFFATPARLKFLKSESHEFEKCKTIFDDIALSNYSISFKLFDSNKERAHYEKTDNPIKRINDIFGESFSKNIFEIKGTNGDFSLRGYVGVPTFNKSTSTHQYFFVNGRLVKDKIFASALKSAYAGLIPNGRYAVAVLFLDMPFSDVDVNVHPAKTEVRFREAEKIRSFIIFELKKAIESYGSRRSSTDIMDRFYSSISNPMSAIPTGIISGEPSSAKVSERFSERVPSRVPSYSATATATALDIDLESDIANFSELAALEKQAFPSTADVLNFPANNKSDNSKNYNNHSNFASNISSNIKKITEEENIGTQNIENKEGNPEHKIFSEKIFLGNAVYQVSNTYVVAVNENGIVIIDQHAAAERITLEEFKNNLKLKSQNLLIPEKTKLNDSQIELLKNNDNLLKKLGVYIEYENNNSVSITAIPALLETSDANPMLTDIIDDLSAFGSTYTLDDKIHHILSTISCHSSLRAGKKLSIQEMNFLIRKMENTPNIAQCCHGRPSYINLTLKDLNNFFERT